MIAKYSHKKISSYSYKLFSSIFNKLNLISIILEGFFFSSLI